MAQREFEEIKSQFEVDADSELETLRSRCASCMSL